MWHTVKFTFDAFEDIGPFYGEILRKKAGLETVDDFLLETWDGNYERLLEKLRAPSQHHFVHDPKHERAEIDKERLEKWGKVFDLFKIPKLKPRIAELLVNAGINSVRELSFNDPVQVLYKMQAIDEDTYVVVVETPSIADVERWIQFAKLMTRRYRRGSMVPLVNFMPVMNLHYASELQKYEIWTIEDLEANAILIPRLYSRIGMTLPRYHRLLGLCDLCRLDGIDSLIAHVLEVAGIGTLRQLRESKPEVLFDRLTKVLEEPALAGSRQSLAADLTRDGVEQLVQGARGPAIDPFVEMIS